MNWMKNTLIVLLVLIWAGCGSKDSSVKIAQPGKPPSQEPVSANKLVETPPPPAAPAPAAPAPGAADAANKSTSTTSGDDVLAPFRKNYADDTTVSELEALQRVVDDYNRSRPGSVIEPGQKEWPELSANMSELVTYHRLKQLPKPPEGKRYVYDPKTAKVSLQ